MRKEFDEDEPKKSTRGKKNNQKMKPFLVYQYLMRHTDENHVIRADDICLAMAETYGIDAERRGIYRDIDEINKAILAFEEEISIEEAAEWIEEDESLKNIIFDKHKKGFCMQQRHYDYTDIQLLVESIYASKYLSEPQAERLIKILCEFVSEFQEKKIRHNAILTDRVKTNNSGVLNNIEKIDAAMSMEDKHTPEKISFKYLKYSISNLNQQVERRHGSRYEVSPYALLINDGNYYLLAYNDYVKDLRTYRVDRMKDVKLLGVERGVEHGRRVDVAELPADTFREALVVRTGLRKIMTGYAGDGIVSGQPLVDEQLFTERHLGGIDGERVRQRLQRFIGMTRSRQPGGIVGGTRGLHPIEDGGPVFRRHTAAPVHGGKLRGRHGFVDDNPFHLGKRRFADRLVLRGFDQFQIQVHRPKAVVEILFDDFLDPRNFSIERQIIIP